MLSKGYFPKEIPQAFSSESLGEIIQRNYGNLPNLFRNGGHVSIPSIHNSSRPGLLRRKLSIPNPINMFRVSECITENWLSIEAHVNTSSISLTTPQFNSGLRAIDRKHSLNDLPELSANIRSKSRYILKADVSRFYHSIYTHSIPWALHTKEASKLDRSPNLFGNSIDKATRDSQDQQTMGIPIGPDTSLVIAESIMTCIDNKMSEKFSLNGLRYIDDIHLGFRSLGEAEDSLSYLQELLNEFELALNPLKTEVIELPESFENLGISELRSYNFRDSDNLQKSDLLHYFNLAFDFAKKYPKEPILKFAVSRLISINVIEGNYQLFENLILQCASAQPDCLRYVTNHFVKYMNAGFSLDRDKISEVLNFIIDAEASSSHGNEVSSCLWAMLALGLSLQEESAGKVIPLRDPICAILLTDLNKRSLVIGNPDWSLYESYMTKNELKGDMWLFTYESLRRDWFPSVDRQDPLSQHECFRFLRDNNCIFYDDTFVNSIEVQSPLGWSLYPGSISG